MCGAKRTPLPGERWALRVGTRSFGISEKGGGANGQLDAPGNHSDHVADLARSETSYVIERHEAELENFGAGTEAQDG
jgi:hypothetical protein